MERPLLAPAPSSENQKGQPLRRAPPRLSGLD